MLRVSTPPSGDWRVDISRHTGFTATVRPKLLVRVGLIRAGLIDVMHRYQGGAQNLGALLQARLHQSLERWYLRGLACFERKANRLL